MDRLGEAISEAIFSFYIIIRCVYAGWPQGSPLRSGYKRCGEVWNPPVTASPCQPPLGKGAMGTGVRIATTSLRTGLAMTPFTRGAVQHRRADRGVRPYGWGAWAAVRGRAGRPGGRPLRKRYKGCSARQAGDRKGRPYGGLQEVRWVGRTEASAPTKMCCRGGVLPRPREGQSPSPTHSLLRNTAKKRDARRRLFFVVSRLYLTCCTGPYRRQPSRQRYLRAS